MTLARTRKVQSHISILTCDLLYHEIKYRMIQHHMSIRSPRVAFSDKLKPARYNVSGQQLRTVLNFTQPFIPFVSDVVQASHPTETKEMIGHVNIPSCSDLL